MDGTPVKELGENYRNLLGYMPQNLGVYRDFTAEQYLLYIAALKGTPKKDIQEKVYEQLKAVGLEQSAKDKLKSFSGGMIRRIGIAQTLLNSPMILLLDEPTAGLDPQERIRLRNILSSLSEHSIVVLSTHIVSDVELIADKVILLNNGTLLAADRVNDLLLYEQYAGELTDEKVAEILDDFQTLRNRYETTHSDLFNAPLIYEDFSMFKATDDNAFEKSLSQYGYISVNSSDICVRDISPLL